MQNNAARGADNDRIYYNAAKSARKVGNTIELYNKNIYRDIFWQIYIIFTIALNRNMYNMNSILGG